MYHAGGWSIIACPDRFTKKFEVHLLVLMSFKNGSLATYKESFMVLSNITYSTFVDTNMVQVYAKEQYLHL